MVTEAVCMDKVIGEFMRDYSVPGLSLAIALDGELVHAKGYGWADRERGEPVTPSTIFRIASISKPITSVALFTLIESGRLSPEDAVFGSGGILQNDYGLPPYPPYLEQICIDQLLTHTCGGWANYGLDPMFGNAQMNHWQLISWTLANRPLEYVPGERFTYSNFGYCILGRVIEKITGQPYADFVHETVLRPCGITRMSIAGNTRAERVPGEAVYYGANAYNMNVSRMDSHGGWMATAVDLIRFVTRMDDVTSAMREMTTPTPANPRYARGWNVESEGTCWHTGSLSGTTSILMRTSGGVALAALANARDESGADTVGELTRLAWEIVREAREWAF